MGKVGRPFSPPPRTPQTRSPPAPLSHGSCRPSHHTRLPPSTPPAGGVIAALANQRPRAGRPAGRGASEEGRGARERRTAAGLPVTDGPEQPMGSGEMTSSPREVWNWRSWGEEVGGGPRRAGAGRWGLKEAAGHWSPCPAKGGGLGWTSQSCQWANATSSSTALILSTPFRPC